MEIREMIREDEITLEVEGRVDTNTSRLLQEKLLQAFQKGNHICLDLKKVDYVSSAGLRTFLIGEKTAQAKQGSLKLVHIQEPVMEVMRMSGFDKVLNLWEDIQ